MRRAPEKIEVEEFIETVSQIINCLSIYRDRITLDRGVIKNLQFSFGMDFQNLLSQLSQNHNQSLAESAHFPNIRQTLIDQLNKITRRHTISFIASSSQHASSFVNDWDADVIENLFRSYSKLDKIDIILHGVYGFASSAERIVNTIYRYCEDFRVIIPTQAKSAATLIAMGASGVLMSESSEIGGIEPYLPDGTSAQSVIGAYDGLAKEIELKREKNEAYDSQLASLAKIDPVLLQESRRQFHLTKEIAVSHLERKMVHGNSRLATAIAEKFLDRENIFPHGRLIGYQSALSTGLKLEYIDRSDERWKLIWEIYIRAKTALEHSRSAQLIEDVHNSFYPSKLS